jgi:predicted ATPase
MLAPGTVNAGANFELRANTMLYAAIHEDLDGRFAVLAQRAQRR